MRSVVVCCALLSFAIVSVGFYLYCVIARIVGVGGPLFSGSFRGVMDMMSFLGLLLLKNGASARKNLYFEPLISLFAVVCFLNWYFVSGQSAYGLKKLGFLVIIALFPFFLTKLLVFVEHHRKLINIMACLSLILSLASIVVYHFGGAYEIARGRYTIVEGFNTIPSAMVSGVAVVWIWWLAAWKSWGMKKKITLLLFVSSVSLYAMYLTGSRGPVIFLFLAMFFFPPMDVSLFSIKKISVVMALFIIVLVAIVFGPNDMARRRFSRMFDDNRITKTGRLDTIGQREKRFHLALQEGYEHILLGVGLGNTPEKHYAHNSFLEVWEELGLPGAVLYLLIFGGGGWLIWGRRLRVMNAVCEPAVNSVLWFWECILIYAFCEGLVSLTIFSNSLLWVSLGMVAMHRKIDMSGGSC